MRKHDQISLYLLFILIWYLCIIQFIFVLVDFFSSPPPTNSFPFLVLIPSRPSWFLLSLLGWSLLLKNGRRTQSLYLPWSSTNPLRSKHIETHGEASFWCSIRSLLSIFVFKDWEFPAGKMTVESFTFLLSKVCEPGKVRNICSWFIYLPVNRRLLVIFLLLWLSTEFPSTVEIVDSVTMVV